MDNKSQSRNILEKGGLSKVIKLLDSNIEELKIQSILLIGNLANECYKIRDILIKERAIDKIITILSSTKNIQLIRKSTSVISIFFRIQPKPSIEIAKKSLNAICKSIIILPKDIEFLNNASFILCFISEYYKETINDLLNINIIPNLIKMISVEAKLIQMNCLRIIGNIASGNANQTQKLIDYGILDYLKKTLFSNYKKIRKESAWIISNIAAGTQKQIEALIDQNILHLLIKIIKIDQPEIKQECIWALCNLTSVENPVYLKKLLDQGILNVICDCIKNEEGKLLPVSLEAFRNLLVYGKKYNNNPGNMNPIVEKVDKMGMFDVLEKLQLHPIEIVYEKTLNILEDFFDTQIVE